MRSFSRNRATENRLRQFSVCRRNIPIYLVRRRYYNRRRFKKQWMSKFLARFKNQHILFVVVEGMMMMMQENLLNFLLLVLVYVVGMFFLTYDYILCSDRLHYII